MMVRRQVGRSLVVGLAVIVGLGLGVLAQSISLTVTAYSDAVRFSAQGSVKELRVEVLSLSGQKVFDSGPVLGAVLDWKLLNTQGQPVANGVYLYTVTVKDPFGNVTKKLGKLAVLRGKGVAAPPLTLPTVGELASEKFRLAPQAFDVTNWYVSGQLGVGTDTPNARIHFAGQAGEKLRVFLQSPGAQHAELRFLDTTVMSGRLIYTGGNSAGARYFGFVAYVDKDGNPLPIRFFTMRTGGSSFGDENQVLYLGTGTNPISYFSGRLGVGTPSPTETLTVAGVIYSTTGGIKFPDGTIQTTAASPGASGWTDGGTTVSLTTATDNVGIGTSTANAKTHISNTANQPGLRIDSSAGTNALEIYNTEGGQNLIFRVERTTGNVYADGNFTGNGADVAERIDVTEAVEPGDVVEIDPDNPGKFRKAREALSTRVAGVISTAPGVVLGNQRAESNDARPILALAGRVPVKVTAKYGAIAVGDLLVSSPIPGYAMKCPEKSQCIGAVIGKALEPLTEGVGMIEVQVMLR
jgi:hypothetical protein